MPQYLHDKNFVKWLILAPDRNNRPDNYEKGQADLCPFCPGNEDCCEVEVLRYGEGEKNQPGWKVRVIPNKYPLNESHEVIIHTPDPEKSFENLPVSQIILVLHAYRERYNFYKDKGNVIIFCNQGEHAGASLKHSHSQLLVLPEEVKSNVLEKEEIQNIVKKTAEFTAYCPEFSEWPYEVWISPNKEGGTYGESTDSQLQDLASLMQHLIQRLKIVQGKEKFSMPSFGYNFYIYPKNNWYIRIIPRFIHRGGLELATEVNVNTVSPSQAAKTLKQEEFYTPFVV